MARPKLVLVCGVLDLCAVPTPSLLMGPQVLAGYSWRLLATFCCSCSDMYPQNERTKGSV